MLKRLCYKSCTICNKILSFARIITLTPLFVHNISMHPDSDTSQNHCLPRIERGHLTKRTRYPIKDLIDKNAITLSQHHAIRST